MTTTRSKAKIWIFLRPRFLTASMRKQLQKNAAQQKHLTQSQRNDIQKLVEKHGKLFSGKLGHYKDKLIHRNTPAHTNKLYRNKSERVVVTR